MKIAEVPFYVVAWATVLPTKHAGKTGEASWRTSSCQVAEDINPHRSFTKTGARLFIVD